MIAIKPGVRIAGLSNEALLAIMVARDVYAWYGQQERCVITSITDGDHKAGSLHHTGRAIDLRLPAAHTVGDVVQVLTDRLGVSYDIVLEKDHIHVEYDP